MIVVDRIEGNRAVLLVGEEAVEVPLAALPANAREGDVLAFVLDPEGRASRIRDAEARLERLRNRGPQGPDTTDL